MRSIVLAAAFIAVCNFAFAANPVKGYVYDDANGNSRRDGREKGVASVVVSNGRDVVLTDAKGFYQLPLEGDGVVFVVKPSGYAVPTDADNLPRFYYFHRPEGSPPGMKHPGFAPTGPLPSSVDFALRKSPEPDDFSFFLFGDPQPYSLRELDCFRRGIVEYAAQRKGPAFGISLGDICGDDPGLHKPYAEVMRQMGLPWYNVVGNHDRNYDAPDDYHSNESFSALFGPTDYAFRYGRAHFIVLDDIIAKKRVPGERDYSAGLRDDQLDFVENYLKLVGKDELIFMAMHIPLARVERAFDQKALARLFGMLREYTNVVALTAHTHTQNQLLYGEKEGWLGKKPFYEYNVGTTNGDWYSGELDGRGVPVSTMRDGTPKGYAVMEVKGNAYSADYFVPGKPDGYDMQIYCPKVISNHKNTSASIYVNVFLGSPEDNVEYRIDGGEWKKMQRVDEPDPTYTWLVMRWDMAEELMPGKRPSNPEASAHLWRAPLNPRLALGEHKVEIRAADIYGRTRTGLTAYRIEKKLP